MAAAAANLMWGSFVGDGIYVSHRKTKEKPRFCVSFCNDSFAFHCSFMQSRVDHLARPLQEAPSPPVTAPLDAALLNQN